MNIGGDIWGAQYEQKDYKFRLLSSNLEVSRIAVSTDGRTVAVTDNGEIYTRPKIFSQYKWEKIPGNLKNVGISTNYIVGTDSNNQVYWLDLKK